MKPILWLDDDVFAMETRERRDKAVKGLEAEGWVVLFRKPGARAEAIFPPALVNGKKGKKGTGRG